jgi:hypothetical protein
MNRFQLDLMKGLIEMLSPIALGDVAIAITKGPREVTSEVKLVSQGIAFWVYEDGASIRGKDTDVRFEAESYESETALATAFMGRVKTALSTL